MTKKMRLGLVCLCVGLVALLVYIKFKPYFEKTVDKPSELVTIYKDNLKKVKNMEITGQLNISATSSGMTIPIKMDFDTKTDIKKNTYTENNTNISFLGMDMNTKTKSYSISEDNKKTTYTYSDDTGVWQMEEDETGTSDKLDDMDKYLKDIDDIGKLEKTKEGYEISIDLSKIKAEKLSSLAGEYSSSTDAGSDSIMAGLPTSTVNSASGTIVLKFNKDNMMTNVTITDCKIETSGDATQDSENSTSMMGSGNSTIEISGEISISKYNELKEDEYTVTDEAKEAAKPYEPDNTGEDKEDDTESSILITDEWGNVLDKDDQEAPDIPDETTETDASGYSFIVKINDTKMELPVSYTILKNSGWTVNLEDYGIDDSYELNTAERINNNIELYNQNYQEPIIVGFENRGSESKKLINSDIWSIDIKKISGATPDVNINGITWNSTEDDIKGILGKYDFQEEYSDGYINKYIRDDGELTQTLEIYFTDGKITEFRLSRE